MLRPAFPASRCQRCLSFRTVIAFANGEPEHHHAAVRQAVVGEWRSAVALYFSSLPRLRNKDQRQCCDQTLGHWCVDRHPRAMGSGLPHARNARPGGIGVGVAFPPLAAAGSVYREPTARLEKGRQAARSDGVDAVIVSKLSDTDISAVAAYYAGNVGPLTTRRCRSKQ